ncbi:YggS family pyridoxal phosphate-dependent enzyme [Vagococcus sp.]|uniref:YggS family pyridoxal phosphate-dependent enzyme n=1 Tax=Vagococcus sp. TaxID=1933889 RepID=UPI003F959E7D
MIKSNVLAIRQTIEETCQKSGRHLEEVRLICVSKSVNTEKTIQVIECGVIDLAENRVDKLLEKKQDLSEYNDLKWHFIGNLQRRKVKEIINEIDYFHALDNMKLAEEIQKRAKQEIKCFVQINVSGETSKQGLSPDELLEFVKELAGFDKIKIVGLMTMAPIDATEEQLHNYFFKMKSLQNEVISKNLEHAPCCELSMGMSQDYEIAVEEGATFIRVGSAFFKN